MIWSWLAASKSSHASGLFSPVTLSVPGSLIVGLGPAYLIFVGTTCATNLKIFFVILMSACHGFFIKCYKSFYNKKNRYNDKFFRIINEVPTIFLVVIVFLAVFKPSF